MAVTWTEQTRGAWQWRRAEAEERERKEDADAWCGADAKAMHEEIERLERAAAEDLEENEEKTHWKRLKQEHRVGWCLDRVVERSKQLVEAYEDADGIRMEERRNMAGETTQTPFISFYGKLRDIRETHKRIAGAFAHEADVKPLQTPDVSFSGEEKNGRYLDLNELHVRYVNAKFGKEIDYVTYLKHVGDFSHVEMTQKLDKSYRDYLEDLVRYLKSFHRRAKPLVHLDKLLEQQQESFEKDWKDRGEESWMGGGGERKKLEAEAKALLEPFGSCAELQALGTEQLKEMLSKLGLKCGGTLEQRAERLFSVKNKDMNKWDPKIFAKSARPLVPKSKESLERQKKLMHETARLEWTAAAMVNILHDFVESTYENVEKKQALTAEELEEELRDDEENEDQEIESDEEERIYNPLKLPLGWDGKPIPFWLYKLHGLNQEFKCEICGNQSYWGRRAYEQHFSESRHLHGLQSLGIPNSKEFFEITKIKEAQELWESLKRKKASEGWKPEAEEECEDEEGNVYSKKTYTDLKRQGLI